MTKKTLTTCRFPIATDRFQHGGTLHVLTDPTGKASLWYRCKASGQMTDLAHQVHAGEDFRMNICDHAAAIAHHLASEGIVRVTYHEGETLHVRLLPQLSSTPQPVLEYHT